MRFVLALIPALALLALSGCGRGAGTASAAPANSGELRIVALSPAIAVMLRDLGFERQIVGRHAYDIVLDRSIPPVGDLGGVDYETLLRVRPTHVYTEFGEAGVPDRLRALADQHGWALEDFRLRTLDDIATTMDELALDLRGLPEGGAMDLDPAQRFRRRELPSARLANAWRDRGPAVRGAGRVLLVGADGPAGVLGPGSFHQELLVRMGGTPAATEGGAWMDLDAEDVLRLAPDAIVVFVARTGEADPDERFVEPEPAGLEAARAHLGAIAGLPIPAVERGRVAVIEDPLALLPSSSLAGVADQLAAVLERWSADAPEPAGAGAGPLDSPP